MRWRLALMAAAITSMVLVAFLVPLAHLVRTIPADRALNAAELEARSLTPVLATVHDRQAMELAVERLNQGGTGRVTVFLPGGEVLGQRSAPGRDVELARRGLAFSTSAPGGRQILVPVVLATGETAVVRSFVPDHLLRRGVARAWVTLVGLGLGLLALAVLVADRLARSVVRPMRELATVAHRLESGDLQARVRTAGPREVVAVAHALNRLAERIGELLVAERESVADLSHRLRTPVTALRLDAESLRDPEEAARLGADVDALERTVDGIIREARRPVREGVRAMSDVAEVVRDRVGFWAVLAEDQGRAYRLRLSPEPRPVAVHGDDLAAAVDALLGNVFAHTPEGTGFTVTVEPAGNGLTRLVVEDEAPGLPDDALLERGASGAGSTGLGLDIVRRTAEASGGRLVLSSSELGGARIAVELGSAHR